MHDMPTLKNLKISETAAMKRLDRALVKKHQQVRRFRAGSAEAKQYGRFYIVDTEAEQIIATADEITTWMKTENVIKDYEFVEGEGKPGYENRSLT
ncbi:hypothetical protein C7S56_21890 [Salmonella enterica subsp. enterica serovar 4,5,12:b:-]|nr:hypothetical protein [Salmonella enterica subsp. enterica serovar Brunei]EAA8258248.1 hypothetical protein [Salmonella enterica subsp. enterica]EAA9401469.1 hypothetical protein [Salmonella enterica subsp. enterica serovar 4,5,12:b:-]EAB1472853.1 hypothetical protein [Salmonella enterica]EBQ9391894.1 hypothetical protein [Salmonella enterica subsp. enterica serovar Javiana]EBS4936831.1 hypothetical protein [Salmonella enterica subsp. enterica serovar Goverdhan]EBV5391666.1 hypothetical pro